MNDLSKNACRYQITALREVRAQGVRLSKNACRYQITALRTQSETGMSLSKNACRYQITALFARGSSPCALSKNACRYQITATSSSVCPHGSLSKNACRYQITALRTDGDQLTRLSKNACRYQITAVELGRAAHSRTNRPAGLHFPTQPPAIWHIGNATALRAAKNHEPAVACALTRPSLSAEAVARPEMGTRVCVNPFQGESVANLSSHFSAPSKTPPKMERPPSYTSTGAKRSASHSQPVRVLTSSFSTMFLRWLSAPW